MGTEAYFEPRGGHRYRASEHTVGAWSADEQHVGPTIGLLTHAIEQDAAARQAGVKALARLSVDILGTMPLGDVEVAVDVVRPGRTIELVEATASQSGRVAVRARAWRLLVGVTAGAGAALPAALPAPLPAPSDVPTDDMGARWPLSGFIGSLHVRRAADAQPGRARAWVDTDLALVAGEEAGPVARFALLLDVANGIAPAEDPLRWFFANVDLTAHLHRTPVAGPVGFDQRQVLGPGGLGLTDTVLHDVDGPVGRLAQSLTVRRRAGQGD